MQRTENELKEHSPFVPGVGQRPVHRHEIADVLVERVVLPTVVHQFLDAGCEVGGQHHWFAHLAVQGAPFTAATAATAAVAVDADTDAIVDTVRLWQYALSALRRDGDGGGGGSRPFRRRSGGRLHDGGRLLLLFHAALERKLVVQQPVVVCGGQPLRLRLRLRLVTAATTATAGRRRDPPVLHEQQHGDRQPDGTAEHQALEQRRLTAVQVRRDFHVDRSTVAAVVGWSDPPGHGARLRCGRRRLTLAHDSPAETTTKKTFV